MNAVAEKLRAFVCEHSEQDTSGLTDQTPLFENGLLKSIQIMDLILFIEELSGNEIDVERLQVGTFRDIATIVRGFFAAGQS